ncbi:MAG: phytoene/squalene synthase family protein [Proteobacteria bacterium]|nr:phytoene/squalene synthase family protein [Pseudomonadota bacterium]
MPTSNTTDSMSLADGFAAARAITKQCGRTFYFSAHFLPREKRYATYSVYALCRISDDTVDNNCGDAAAHQLNTIKNKIDAVYNRSSMTDPVLLAFRETVFNYSIPKLYYDELIDGMYMDVHKSSYDNFDELYRYCYKVAGVVGLIMLKIFGSDNARAEAAAVQLGIAMQLTNILRDIKEDFERGRIYLPLDELERFGVTRQSLSRGIVDDNFKSMMRFQIKRARTHYEQSAAGIKMITDVRSRFVACAMKDLYAQILTAIEENNYDVFTIRAHVGTLRKLKTACGIFLKGNY